MQFLVPGMLLGAFGVAVPVAIHLLNRYRYKEVDWGAMELLRKVLIVRSRRIRLEDLILLLVRCAIVVVIALMLARPVLSPEGASWLGKSSENVSVVVALDASFSMAHKPGVKSRFDAATERVRDLARTLKPGNSVTLVLMGDRPRFLMRNESFDPVRFEGKLKEAAPLPERLNLDTCLRELGNKEFLDELKAGALEVYIVTDAQTNSWDPAPELAHKSIDDLAKVGKVFVLPIRSENSENLAITKFDMKSGLLRKGLTVEVQAKNFGKQPRDVPIALLVNNLEVDQQTIEKLGPGQSASVGMFARIDKAGPARLTARIKDDELAIDNTRHAVADVHEKLRVLLVRSSDAEERDYVLTALIPSSTDALVVDSISWLDLPKKKLADYQAVILSNIPDLPDEQMRTLYYFVKEGGGLIVFLGDNVQPALVNARFQFEKTPMLPATIGDLVADSKGLPIQAVEHPLSRIIAGLPQQVTSEARVMKYFKMTTDSTGREAIKIAGRGDPLLAEKALGRGRVVVFASAPDRAWTNMVIEPGFYPILIHEATSYVTRKAHERQYAVSEPLNVPLPVSLKEGLEIRKVTFLPQGGAPTTRDADKLPDGQVVAKLPNADQPGFYEITTEPPSTPVVVAVNVDTTESNVETLSAEALTQLLRGWPLRVIPESESLATSVRENRIGRELWKDLLYLAIALVVFEGLFARWITRKKMGTADNW